MNDEYIWLFETLVSDLENNRKFKMENEACVDIISYKGESVDETYLASTFGSILKTALSVYKKEEMRKKIYNMDPEELKRMICEAFEKAQIDFEIKDGGQITGFKGLINDGN